MNEDESMDRLYESLILDPVKVSAAMPPEYVRGNIWPTWWGRPATKEDIAYYDTDKRLHRVYGPAYVSPHYKYEIWYLHGELHHEGGPAIILKNAELWFLNGRPHRLDGPAISGTGRKREYWISGQQLSPKFYKLEIERRKRKGLLK
jgi:hypothetical protein